MSRINAPLTAKHVEDFFRIGKQTKIDTVPRTTFRGQNIDPNTGKPAVQKDNEFVPPYRRHSRYNNPSQTAYARVYRERAEEELRNLTLGKEGDDDGASVSTGGLEHIDSLSMTTGYTESTVRPVIPTAHVEETSEIYTHYNFRHNYNENLSIYKFRRQILDTIESNQVTVIQGQTGCGKTTQVPQYILDSYAQQNRKCNIVVTQPRRIAANSIARRICHERNWQIGTICGYQVGMEKIASEDTRLLYCTTGVLLQKLIGEKNMQDYTHVILDEVHERDQETDFTLLVVRKLLHTNSRNVKVILMSATIDCDLFANYFAVHVRNVMAPAPILEVKGDGYNVQEYYLENLQNLGELPKLDPSHPKIDPLLYDIAKKLITQFDNIEIQEYGRAHKGLSTRRGSVLCFLPGLGEITEFYDKLRSIESSYKLKLKPLHSTITADEQARVFDKPAADHRKVIMSTNIAESSITVPDIKYVIDFCLTKNLISDTQTGYTSLQLQWASRANCKQRKGRAGRVSDGRVYRFVTRNFYEDFIEEYSLPEMERCPLDLLVLRSKQLDLGDPPAIFGLALSPPRLDDLEYTILRLKEVGALASLQSGECNPYDGDLTFLGRVLAELPMDIRLGKLILLGHVFGFLEECIIISACLTNKSFFNRPYKGELLFFSKKFEWSNYSYSDCLAHLNAFKTWKAQKEKGRFPSRVEETHWAKDAFIQLKRIHDVAEQVDDLKRRLRKFNIVIPSGSQRHSAASLDKEIILKVILCGAFYPNYFLLGHVDEADANKELSGHNPHTTVMVRGMPPNQGNFYKKEVIKIFARCDATGQLPKVYCEETRAYIEFLEDPSENTSSKIHPAVYLALKMRDLRVPMEIKMLDPLAAKERMQEQSRLQISATSNSQSLRSHRTEVPEQSDEVKDTPQVALPDASISTVQLYPTLITDCGSFWCQYAYPETQKKMNELQEHINLHGGSNLQQLAPENREVGSLCLAPYTDGTSSSLYYRAKIVKLSHNTQMAVVFFVDYGNMESVSYYTLRELEEHFRGYPLQAFKCQVAGIKPSPIKCPNSRWTEEAKNEFSGLIQNSDKCFGQIYSIVHNVLRVDLVLTQAQGPSINVKQKLMTRCYADSTEEDFQSKQNNRQRQDNPHPTVQASQSEAGKAEPVEVVKFQNHVDVSFVRKQGGGMFRLNGPTSPYEVKFHNYTNIGRMRTCRVDRDSLNCVTIDDEPQTSFERMMVSAYVGLNPSGSSMVARDTTLMPSIPGLPALMCMLFTPTMEIRTDRAKKRFTGSLCGLGWDPQTSGPALGDHDIEVQFDTVIDVEDLESINAIRLFINLGLGSNDQTAEWAEDAVLHVQQVVRDKLHQLLTKRRELVTTEDGVCPNPYRWNLVDQNDIRHPNIPGGLQDSYFLTPHSCVQLVGSDSEDEDSSEAEPVRRAQPSRTEALRELRTHVQWLHKQACRSTQMKPMTCNLCEKNVRTPRELMLHLQTKNHKRNEAALNSEHL